MDQLAPDSQVVATMQHWCLPFDCQTTYGFIGVQWQSLIKCFSVHPVAGIYLQNRDKKKIGFTPIGGISQIIQLLQ